MRSVVLAGGDENTVLPEAMAEARTALSLDERDPWAHMAYGVVLLRTRRYSDAEQALRRALVLNPNFALGHAIAAAALVMQGAADEAVKRTDHALRLSPGDPLVAACGLYATVYAHFFAARYADCVVAARDAVERYPERQWIRSMLIAAAAMYGDNETASEALRGLLCLRPDFSLRWFRENALFAETLWSAFSKDCARRVCPRSNRRRFA